MVYEIITGERGVNALIKARKERIRVTTQLNYAMAEKNKIEEEIRALKNPLYLEEEIRKITKKGKKGEVFYIFSEEKNNFEK